MKQNLFRREADIFLTALMFFTRIPVPKAAGYTYDPDYLQKSSRYFPLIGWIVGGVAGLTVWLLLPHMGAGLAVLLSMAVSILLTGAFHEDGWADVCDGFGGGMSKMRVLEIMKDSRLGTYGTLGLLLLLGLKWQALVALAPSGRLPLLLLAVHAVSRLAAASVIFTHEYVRENEDSKAKPLATRINGRSLLLAALFGLLPMLLLPPIYWWGLVGVLLARYWLVRWFVRRIGGYTGDCLGAVQQVTEVMFYLICAGVIGVA